MRNSLICLIVSLFPFWSFAADGVEICGDLRQGEILIGRGVRPAARVSLNGREYLADSEGRFLVVLSRDEKSDSRLQIDDRVYHLPIAAAQWDVQSIKGVAQRKVTPSTQDEGEILREQKDVRQALQVIDMGRQNWEQGFELPLEGQISGHFGNQRIFNGVPKSPHSGTDIAAPSGTPVKASAPGKVLLSGGNYFYSGNMVILDHGTGLQTIYAHLQKATVKEGEEVEAGDVIGLVGQTGRATGPHLHWGASLDNVRFRPHSLLDLKKKKCKKLDGE